MPPSFLENQTQKPTDIGTMGEVRSSEAAKETSQSYSSAEKEPLASHKSTESKPGITFAAQDKLPRLPIPELEDTCKRYLEALLPLQSPAEHRETEVAVQEFLESDGPILQERLKQYAKGKANYIEQFCVFSPLCQYHSECHSQRLM
jgi:carnitine O-acetyltransferase